jgi:hypothetical protein
MFEPDHYYTNNYRPNYYKKIVPYNQRFYNQPLESYNEEDLKVLRSNEAELYGDQVSSIEFLIN